MPRGDVLSASMSRAMFFNSLSDMRIHMPGKIGGRKLFGGEEFTLLIVEQAQNPV